MSEGNIVERRQIDIRQSDFSLQSRRGIKEANPEMNDRELRENVEMRCIMSKRKTNQEDSQEVHDCSTLKY